uniref:Rho-GAP domain-containing protein n=1 Tax=Rhabditophanes sp. KR3021 TaxID=114890 RepID=A0AC35TR44_9BILA
MGDTPNCKMSKSSKRMINSVDGLILKNISGAFKYLARDNDDIIRLLETLTCHDNTDVKQTVEEKLALQLERENQIGATLEGSLQALKKIQVASPDKSIMNSPRPVSNTPSAPQIKSFNLNLSRKKHGSFYIGNAQSNSASQKSPYPISPVVEVVEYGNVDDRMVPVNSITSEVLPKETNSVINQPMFNDSRMSMDSLVSCNRVMMDSTSEFSPLTIAKHLAKTQDDDALMLLSRSQKRMNKEEFSRKSKLRRSISDSNLLNDTPIIENQLLDRQKKKDQTNYWTPLDCILKKNGTLSLVPEHILPINTIHSFIEKKGFNVRCCFCTVRKFSAGEKLVCVNCGIEMHYQCCTPDRTVPCVVMERRRKVEQTKRPVYLGKICTQSRPMIPAVLIRLVDRIESSGMLTSPGLYCHVSDNESDQVTLKAVAEEKFHVLFDSKSTFTVPDALKRLLNNLAEPLIPPSSWKDICLGVKNREGRKIHREILNLPVTNKDTLAFLMRHFQIVLGLFDRNHMTKAILVHKFTSPIIGIPKFKRDKIGTFEECEHIANDAFEYLLGINSEFWETIIRTSNDPSYDVFKAKSLLYELQPAMKSSSRC